MSASEQHVNGVDPVQFGILIGKVDTVITKLNDFEGNFVKNDTLAIIVENFNKEITELKNAKKENKTNAIAILACCFSGMCGVGTVLALVLK